MTKDGSRSRLSNHDPRTSSCGSSVVAADRSVPSSPTRRWPVQATAAYLNTAGGADPRARRGRLNEVKEASRWSGDQFPPLFDRPALPPTAGYKRSADQRSGMSADEFPDLVGELVGDRKSVV